VTQLMCDATAAAGYERGFARISSHFIPFCLVQPAFRPAIGCSMWPRGRD